MPPNNNNPPCRVLLRSKDGVEVFTVSSSRDSAEGKKPSERRFLVQGGTSIQTYAPDGSCVYLLLSEHGVVKCPLNEEVDAVITRSSTPFLADSGSIQMMTISPKGTYLLTWERLYPDTKPQNLRVWCAKTGKLLAAFAQKVLKREGWPYLQWTADEEYAFLMATNEVRVFPGQDFLRKGGSGEEVRYVDKLRCPGITSMSVPQVAGNQAATSYLFTSFCPQNKDKPARASLHEYSASTPASAKSAPSFPAVHSKSLYQAEEMKVHWSPKGDSALITLQTSVDASGQSYYGSATLYLLAKEAKDVIGVPLPQEGPVLDVKWMPNPTKPNSCFVVVAGKMPAMASLHDGRNAEPLFLFGNAHRNTISWSDHGRFLCLAGFGNLAGGMNFWDRNKLKLIPPTGTNTASCTVGYGWSPDSRLFIVSTTSPRMNVDNGAKLYRYNGEDIDTTTLPWDNQNYLPNKLLEASFVPALPNVYPDRPQSPQLKHAEDGGKNNGAQAAAAKKAPSAEAKKPAGRYVPPSARGRAGGTSLADRIRREKEGNTQGAKKVTNRPGSVVGAAAQPVETKSKSALKRERAKAAKQKKAEEEAKKAEEEAKKKQQEAEAAANDPEKRARKLKKALKQIDDLKKKDPSALNDDQKKKIASEAELRAELAKLGI